MRWAAAIVVSFGIGVGGVTALPAQGLARAVEAAEALGARTGVAVVDGDGKVLYRHRSGEAFAPASNMKVLTAAAVLSGLGSDFEFVTEFALRNGRLVVTASGDPNWIRDTAHAPADVFAGVARALQQAGATSVGGIDLIAGDFTGPTRPATWPQDQLHTYYCAPTGPFVLEQGVFWLRLQPAAGERADVDLVAPVAAIALRNQVTMQDGKKNVVYGAIDGGDGSVRVTGRFPRRSTPVEIRTAMSDPQQWYRLALEKALTDAGLVVGRPTDLADRVVHRHRSDLKQAVLRMLEDSSNFDAEQCLRVLGHQRGDGSLAGGTAALQKELQQLLGQVPDAAVFADGSGLSKQNRLTPGLLVVAMVQASRGKAGPVLRACLPVAGQSGTLTDRFVGTDLVGRVRAKTGWIRGASALSGLVEGKDGRVRWFSILMNYDPKVDGLNKDLKQLQEQIVRAIDTLDAR
jgi:D-alanyl-D-alanine carboxypeptidase/D-alanyl-D-alanine-endopeptidase (penicillin-binding protein 4)